MIFEKAKCSKKNFDWTRPILTHGFTTLMMVTTKFYVEAQFVDFFRLATR